MATLAFIDGFEDLTMAGRKIGIFTGATQQDGPNLRGNSVLVADNSQLDASLGNGIYSLFCFRFKPTQASGWVIRGEPTSGGNNDNWSLRFSQTQWTLYGQNGSIIATATRNGDNWVHHQLQISRSGGATVRWKVDDVTIVGSGTYNTVDTFGYGTYLDDDGWYDDFIIIRYPNTDMSDMPGPVAVERIVPTSNGFHTAWTGDYTAVDEVPHSTADSIVATAAADRESYGFSSPAGTPTGLTAVVWEVTGAGRPVLPLVRTSGVTGTDSAFAIPTEGSGLVMSPYIVTNPATASPWAVGDLSSEFGLEAD